MELLRRVLSNVVNTIVPNTFNKPSSTAGKKRSASVDEPELTDDEDVSETFCGSTKRMKPGLDSIPTSTGSGLKPFGTDFSRGRVIPIEFSGANAKAAGSSKALVPVTGRSIFSHSRPSSFFSASIPVQRNNLWSLKRDLLKKPRGSHFLRERFGKSALPVYQDFKRNVVRLQEKSNYVKLVDSLMATNYPSKSRLALEWDCDSQNGAQSLALVKSKVPERELVNTITKWYDAPHATYQGSLNSTSVKGIRNIPIVLEGEDEPSHKVIDTVDISHDSDSDDSVICDTPISTPKQILTPDYRRKSYVTTKEIESLGQRIRRVLDTTLGDIEKPIVVVDLDLDDDQKSTTSSSAKENHDEVHVVSPPPVKSPPISSLDVEILDSRSVNETWPQIYKRTEKQRKGAESQREDAALQNVPNESSLEGDLEERFQRNLTFPEVILVETREGRKLPEITEEMRAIVRRHCYGKGADDVVQTTLNNIDLTLSDINSLAPTEWINDNVINAYLDLMALRSKCHIEWPSVYVFTTFFYPKYLKEGYSNILKRWTRKVDIFSYDLLIFPIHLDVHWCLAAADIRRRTLKYYDSLGGKNYRCLKALLQYLGEEHQERKGSSLANNWTTENVQGIPQQQNGSDCGMFACKFAEYLSRDAEFTFTQEDMDYYRERMVYEIITGHIMHP